ncbi:MAG: DNA cytosine methyltransferase [Methylophilus sp.]|uniref:DNA cytosine methyltransferase n=1 Tax=Methylophilus sp. TaxID=29541 RepID=UPI003F9FF6BB
MNAATHSPIVARAFVPDIATKELAMSHKANGRNIVLSSNFLRMYGFEPGVRHSVTPLDGVMSGLALECTPTGKQKVYERSYTSRRNNAFESQIHIQDQSVINRAIPGYTERLHFEIRHGRILVRPLRNETFSIRKKLFESKDQLNAFVAMTGGIDVRCLMDCGFTIDSVLEYRPPEGRDTVDLSETGVLNVLANSAPRVLYNEDISKISMATVDRLVNEGPVISTLHISLQCDDFSNCKASSLKALALEDLSTSADLVYDALRLVETVRPATIIMEQVANFSTSNEGRLFITKLRKWGYHVSESICSAPEFGGYTKRKRYYVVASVWPGFIMPESGHGKNEPLWNVVSRHLQDCRDVTHTNSVQEGIKTNRIRLIKKDSELAPTILKSQDRQAKDSVYINIDDRFYLPSLPLLAALNGIPADFDFNSVGRSIQSEQIGQSIEVPMHEAICGAVRDHILSNVGKFSMVNIKQTNTGSGAEHV